jgi:hypothetical protein
LAGYAAAFTLRVFCWAALSGCLTMNPQNLQSVVVKVPNDLADVEGNDSTLVPFSTFTPVRYQQVYDASQFSRVPVGGAFITRIWLRANCGSYRSLISTNLQLTVSTTGRAPDQLATAFVDNVGGDQTLVWSNSRYIPPSGGIGPSCPNPFDSSFSLDVPFFYDPTRGNLLLDLRKGGTEWVGGSVEETKLDAHNAVGDSVSRAFAYSLTTNRAEVVDSVGLVTAFEFFPTPSIQVTNLTNSVVLTWPTSPTTFRLQWGDTVGDAGAWADYPGTIGGGGIFRFVSIPASSLPTRKFFRLFWNTPQPLPARPASAVVQVDAVIQP